MQLLEKTKTSLSESAKKIQPKPGNTRIKTPTLLQMEAVECGAAALGIMLSYYGRIVPLSELRTSCGVSRDGSKASNLLKAARNFGLQSKGFKKEVNQLREMKPPYIVFWNFNHFLVVEGFGGDRVFLNDPATGPRSVTAQEFSEAYTGIVLVMEPGVEFKKGGRKPSTIQALSKRLKGSTKEILFCILTNFVLVLPGMATAVFAQVFIDNVLIQNQVAWIRPLLGGMFIVILVQTGLISLQFKKLRYLQLRLSIQMTGQFLWHTLRLPVGFYAQRFAGEISSRMGLNNQVADLLSGQLARSAVDVVMATFYIILMVMYDPVLTLISIISVVTNILMLRWVSRQRTDNYMRLNQDGGKIAGIEISGLQSIETIKSAGLESDFFAKWAGYYAKSITAQQDMLKGDLLLGALPTLLSTLSSMLLLVIGGWRVIDGHLTIGMLIALQGLTNRFQRPIGTLMGLGNQIQQLGGSLNRLDDVLLNPIDPVLKAETATGLQLATPLEICRLQGYVELRNVTFGYSPVDEPLIKNFSCSLKPGQRIAFVGSSGSGKSTVSKLITGLYTPWEGEILFDGIPQQQIPRAVITNSLSMVEQDIFLFGGTVRDNLTLWDDTIPDTQLLQACQDAAILDAVMAITGGLNGKLLEGAANLSGGQRQRMEIARALVNNPSILVMDEATSALDSETEKVIDRNIRRRGCTCIVVAHRLSTIRDCDEIVVMEKGQVVQRGTHEEMKNVAGVYSRLIQSA
ncbi:NHLP family bacteriocin export ABC transporter peptidase/permease/ATPase subunit [Anabaena sp. PCC 7108]|uniref:NHLP family bacteriocin export ABC transporter peptidase/permease/ATPase subunit n=1 Tax=Anabaena sp. PCC 7108 TaxID=163908 RepID=UPI000348DF2F|nr:NHLP family bacteriocin export ABC transporter peptidase/permease/ATPase subunit [Anabaena sp. PCC 7108]